MSVKQPIIGITLDHSSEPTYALYPWYALRENYITAIEMSGGIPLLIPYSTHHIDAYIHLIDGLLLPGSPADINPQFYGVQDCHPLTLLNDKRTQFELKIAEEALKKDLPLFGICMGQQILNVVLGGSLIQHIPDFISSCLMHVQKEPRHQPSHEVTIQKNTLLHQIIQKDTIIVNSRHHQAVNLIGSGGIVNARAPDGVIEGIEVPNHRFCLSVQWHPEYMATPYDHALFKSFIEAAAA